MPKWQNILWNYGAISKARQKVLISPRPILMKWNIFENAVELTISSRNKKVKIKQIFSEIIELWAKHDKKSWSRPGLRCGKLIFLNMPHENIDAYLPVSHWVWYRISTRTRRSIASKLRCRFKGRTQILLTWPKQSSFLRPTTVGGFRQI